MLAITAILLGLIFGPMIQGFNLTNRPRFQNPTTGGSTNNTNVSNMFLNPDGSVRDARFTFFDCIQRPNRKLVRRPFPLEPHEK